jgi:predicted nucleic acid-binding protein
LTLYLDTSLVVSAYTTEAKTANVQEWLNEQPAGELAISDLVVTEFSAALSIKLRTGQLVPETRADALSLFARFCADTVLFVPILSDHFRVAARFADHHELGLRAPDALHLAICAAHGATICTLDRRQSDAGLRLGVSTVLL